MNSCNFIRDFKRKPAPKSPISNRFVQRNNEHHKSHEVLQAAGPLRNEGSDEHLDRKDSTKRNSRSEENLLGLCQKSKAGHILLTQDFFKVSKENYFLCKNIWLSQSITRIMFGGKQHKTPTQYRYPCSCVIALRCSQLFLWWTHYYYRGRIRRGASSSSFSPEPSVCFDYNSSPSSVWSSSRPDVNALFALRLSNIIRENFVQVKVIIFCTNESYPCLRI